MIDDLPGPAMASRPVHFFWVIDTSSSMGIEGKMQQLDMSIREALPEMRAVAQENPVADLLVRTLTFSNGARWNNPQPVPVEDFEWPGGTVADGLTDFGEALRLVASQLQTPPMPERALPPVIAIVSDGLPTDDWKKGLAELDAAPWGKKAVRLAILIGSEQSVDVLQVFTGNPETVFQVANAPQLARVIRWASTAAVKMASEPGRARDASKPAVVGPAIVLDDDDEDDVWV